MENERDEQRGRVGLGGGVGGTTGGSLGGGERDARGQGSGEGGEADVPKLSAAEIDDTTPNPVRDDAVATVKPGQLDANPRADDTAGPGAGTHGGG